MRDGALAKGGSGTRSSMLPALRIALLVGSVAAIVYGVSDGEALVVLAKGVRVCLECIGIA